MSRLFAIVGLSLLATACLEEDFDADGYGISEDCDDQRSTVNPDAIDICNGMDDNCDGVVDDAATAADPGAVQVWHDNDGDGYGADGSERYTCQELFWIPNHATQGGDCNDDAWRVHPGGSGCGGDFDCDGVPEPACEDWQPGGTVLVTDETWFAAGDVVIGTEWSNLPALAFSDGASNRVSVAITSEEQPRVTMTGTAYAGDYFFVGEDIDTLGGLLILTSDASYAASGSGSVVVFDHGAATGDLVMYANDPAIYWGPSGSKLGGAVATVDASASAAPQFAVSAVGADSLYLFEHVTVGSAPTLHATITGDQDLGADLVSEDLDGDGTADLVASAPGGSGKLWFVAGPLPAADAAIVDVAEVVDFAGSAAITELKSTGDLNGDGRRDIAAIDSVGVAYIFGNLPSGGTSDVHFAITHPDAQQMVVREGGDLNDDGNADLVIGLPETHRVGVMFGPVTDSVDAAVTRIWQGNSPETTLPPVAGVSVFAVGDVNNDGVDDFGTRQGSYSYLFHGHP